MSNSQKKSNHNRGNGNIKPRRIWKIKINFKRSILKEGFEIFEETKNNKVSVKIKMKEPDDNYWGDILKFSFESGFMKNKGWSGKFNFIYSLER